MSVLTCFVLAGFVMTLGLALGRVWGPMILDRRRRIMAVAEFGTTTPDLATRMVAEAVRRMTEEGMNNAQGIETYMVTLQEWGASEALQAEIRRRLVRAFYT